MTDKPSTVSDAMGLAIAFLEYHERQWQQNHKLTHSIESRLRAERTREQIERLLATQKAKEETAPADPPKCNCGEQSNIDPMHAPWCPLYIDQSTDDYCGIVQMSEEDTTPGDEGVRDALEQIAFGAIICADGSTRPMTTNRMMRIARDALSPKEGQ